VRESPHQNNQALREMDLTTPSITSPIIREDGEIWFSAYGFGWGYCAYSLSAEVVCNELGAASQTPSQLLLAFELGKIKLSQVVLDIPIPEDGERVALELKPA
jgi:hypothetical protein